MSAYQRERRLMISRQLHARGIVDPRVLAAMDRVPREWFVPPEARDRAYADRALPIAGEQTISQPYIVALMTQGLELTGGERVLEIGTGSGYQTAVLAELAEEVYTVERLEELSLRARSVLDGRGYENIHFLLGDGTLGWPEHAPYDRIVVTAMAPALPQTLFAQLADDGIIVIPLGDSQRQMLQAVRKRGGRPWAVDLCACMFVKLVGAEGWPVGAQ